MIIFLQNVFLDGLKIPRDLKILCESAFRRAKFCEILFHSVRYGVYLIMTACRYFGDILSALQLLSWVFCFFYAALVRCRGYNDFHNESSWPWK